ncbi:LURP-one-related/scramblase family protein [Nocardiopsis eucommiae]|uniref:LURP-one-related/scramblase family protein n=1 Tax=Nocardiopsis eucommiae TaxID=2831970 RepID=UPI003D71F50C
MHAPLFTAPVLLVEQPRRLFAAEGHYEVLSDRGQPLAYVNEHMTAWTRTHRRASQLPHRFTIYAPDGHPLLTLDKPWDRGRPYIHVSGPHHEPYGTIVQDRSFLGSRFRLNDPRGHTVAEIRGDWSGWDFTVLDHAGIEIARIGKEHPGLGGGFFTTEDRYALEFAYDLPWPLRRLVIGAAITVDVLLHEREPEFYHSHYADFHRHPEYGYEPRHHWHHPRRGYVVDRRRRRPLVAHAFVPVRRRPRVASGEHAAVSRRDYRPVSARSEAPAPRAARAPRVERRGGAGFASRSEAPASGWTSRRERRGRAQGGGGTSRAARVKREVSGNRTAGRASDGTTGSADRSSSSPSPGIPRSLGAPSRKASTSRGTPASRSASSSRGTSSRSASSSRGTSSSSRGSASRSGSSRLSGGGRGFGRATSSRSSGSGAGRSSSSRSSSSRRSGGGRSGGGRSSGGSSRRR